MSGIREHTVEGKIEALHHLVEHPSPEEARILLETWDDDDDFYRAPNQWED